jgi:hypothetical protein
MKSNHPGYFTRGSGKAVYPTGSHNPMQYQSSATLTRLAWLTILLAL